MLPKEAYIEYDPLCAGVGSFETRLDLSVEIIRRLIGVLDRFFSVTQKAGCVRKAAV